MMMENSITCANPQMENPSHISPVKYAAAYSTWRNRIFNLSKGVRPM